MLNIHIPEEELDLRPRITVVGCGGGGSNAVNNMISSGLQGVEFLVCNSDAQSLKMSLADRKIQLGLNVTRGLGAGARPDVGRAAADEALDEIMGYLEGSNMVFITAGMGGGTGTGGAPVIARAAKEAGILTVGVVTKPFHFEGAHRMRLADAGIEELQQHVDTLLIIPNQNLFRVANEKTTFADAFKMADEVLHAGVRGVTDLMVMPGLINLDFADIRAVMSEMGKAMMGTGEAIGERRAVEAAEAAINNPLLEDASMQGAKGLLVNITGGMDMTLYEVDEAMNRIRDEVDPDANIIFGSTFSPELDGKIRVSVVATGIDGGMRAYRPVGGGLNVPQGLAPQEPTQPLNPLYNAAPQKATPASMNANPFNRSGVTLRQGPGAAPAPQQTQAVSNTQTPAAPRQTGTGPTSARAIAMQQNASFFSRVATARRIEEEYEPEYGQVTVGEMEAETAEYAYGQVEAHEEIAPQYVPVAQKAAPAPQQRSTGTQRGERDEDGSFIPPMPVMAEQKPVSATSATGSQQQQPQMSAPAPRLEDMLMDTAPVAQAPMQAPVQTPAPQAEKRMGLFDRLTGGSSRQAQAAAPAAAPAPKASVQQEYVQPTLTVDNSEHMPAATSFDEDLEIPAFLRRQAS